MDMYTYLLYAYMLSEIKYCIVLYCIICNLLSFAKSWNGHFCTCMLQKAAAARLYPTLDKGFCSGFSFG